MSNSTKWIIMAIDFIITSFGSPKMTHYLNPMRHHGASIENNYCHQPPPIVTQFIGIYNHFRISPISQSLLLILAQTQYPLKVESSYNIVAWWIMITDSLASWFTIGFIWYASHTLLHLPWQTHLDDQDKPILTAKTSHPSNYEVLHY